MNATTEVITNASGSGSYALNVDAWSIGIVLYCCLSNQSPFDEVFYLFIFSIVIQFDSKLTQNTEQSETTPLPERIRARKIDYNVIRETGCSEIGKFSPRRWTSGLTKTSHLGIDFLSRLLTIDPAKRMTVGKYLLRSCLVQP